MTFQIYRHGGIARMWKLDAQPLDIRHHQEMVESVYTKNQRLPIPDLIIQYHSWNQVVSDPTLTEKTLVFVDGGITNAPIDIGNAVLINDGGIVRHEIKCGVFYTDGGAIEVL